MKVKPLVEALGLNPMFWGRFSFISKQVYWDEKRSHDGFKPGVSAMGRITGRGARFVRAAPKPLQFQAAALNDAYKVVRETIDAQPVPMDNREVL